MGLFDRPKQIVAAVAEKTRGFFSAHAAAKEPPHIGALLVERAMSQALAAAPISHAINGALDDSAGVSAIKAGYGIAQSNMPDTLLAWYMGQGFIGHQVAAFIAQHWLIAKACAMPARDAVRQGYMIVSDDGGDLDAKILRVMSKADEKFHVSDKLVEFVNKGRVFGIRIALFKVESTNPDYYELPFNPDGVTPGSYKGIVQVDPYWCSPQLDAASTTDPASLHFYEPQWWLINGKKYHRSHLVIFRNGELPDILKPVYLYGGVPVPQRIMERVYCSERTANEAPQLAMSKRTTAFGTDISAALADKDKFNERMAEWVEYRDNFAVKIMDKDADTLEQFDTSLADLDAVIMSQYQLVAAAANVPATKLLGTTPKGFNATGEYDESNYHEELESIQKHDLTPLLERHHLLVMRSIVAPQLGIDPVDTSVNWEALDSPTAKEYAEINKIKAERDAALVDAGAIDSVDVRNRLRTDRESDYHGIEEAERAEPDPDPAITP